MFFFKVCITSNTISNLFTSTKIKIMSSLQSPTSITFQ
jgi:hypothetical protein